MTRRTIGTRDTCTRCNLEIEYIGSGRWHDRGGNTSCNVTGTPRRHLPYEHGSARDRAAARRLGLAIALP